MRTITEVRQGAPLSMTFSVDDGSVVLDGIPAGYVQVAVHPEKKMMIIKPCGKKADENDGLPAGSGGMAVRSQGGRDDPV